MSTKFNINPKKITLSEDSPLMREMRKPQLMLVRHFGFSTFFKNKKRYIVRHPGVEPGSQRWER